MREYTQAELEAHCGKLWDSQWVNVVNHDNCYRAWNKEGAVNHAVKMAEEYMRANFDAYAATLRQQGGMSDADYLRKWVRHMADVLEAGKDVLGVDADLARLGAAIQAALAQNTQGDAVPSVTTGIPNKMPQSLGDHAMQTLAGAYTRAERATVPKDLVSAARSLKRLASIVRKYGTCAPGALEDIADSILAVAAPYQPKDAQS